MPFAGFLCEVTPETRLIPNDCLACALAGGKPGCDFTPPLLRGIVAANQPRFTGGWSVTQLACCARKARLMATRDWWDKPSALYWAWRGTVGHAAVEEAHGLDQVIAEECLAVTLDGFLVTGTPDVVYVGRRHLQDYKTTKEVPGPWYVYTCPTCKALMQESRWKLRNGDSKVCPKCKTRHGPQVLKKALSEQPPKPYSGHTAQVSVYRWLLARNGIQVNTAEIVYLDMERVKRVPVFLWSLDHTENWVRGRLSVLTAPELPPPLAETDDAWQCKLCPVSEVCKSE